MTTDLDHRSGAVDRPRAGVRRWLTDQERAALPGPKAARLSLARSIGEQSPAAGPIETWLDSVDSANTREAYAADVRAFVEWLRERHGINADEAPVNVLAVTMDVVANYADAMREMVGRYGKPLSAATTARRLSSLSAMFKHLAARQIVPTNPVRELERPKVSAEGITPARDGDEMARMVRAADGNLRDLLLLLLLLYVSAFRVSEVCRARLDQIRHERGRTLLTVPLKGGKLRNEPLDPAVVEVLEMYLAGRTAVPLLLADDGQALARHHVPPILRRVAKAAGLDKPAEVRPHVLRTSAITAWLDAGQPLHRVRHKVRHASSTTTERYHRRTRGIEEEAALSAALVAELPLGDMLDRLRGEDR
ncbi:tyrosine-type recombinase/integrase [Sphaerisporangium sp. NPDC088356]|uniref:tyrosine-type recombinase/integrase n=1 Tax=Sphaerisporangium sp. NPDC088356 TaxID=3154871 RepID=UPI00341ECBB3